MTEKTDIIKKVYHNPISGYSSIQSTYKEAKSIDKSITLQDVKDYLSKLPQKQLQFKYKGYNSFIANEFLEQIQLDVADFTNNASQNDGFRYGLAGVDVFSRYGWLVPMKTKQPPDLIMAFKEIMRVIGIPKSIFMDQEGGMLSTEFIKVLNENKIEQKTTLNHAPYAEVFIRTLKQMIHDRLHGEGLNLDRWIDVLKPTLSKYNLTPHSGTQMSPYQAKQPKNHMEVLFNNYSKSKHERKYPTINVNDNVRVMIKKTTKTKGTDPKWSQEVFKVIFKINDEYLINDNNRKRVFLRFELLKV